MKKLFVWPAAVASLALTAATIAPAQAAPVQAASQQQTVATTGTPAGPTAEEVRAFVTPEVLDAATAASERLGIELSPLQQALVDAIDPNDYECAPTALTDWTQAQLEGWTLTDRVYLFATMYTNLAGYASMVVPEATPVYGPDGEFTKPVTKTFTDLQRFWDISSEDIQLVPMHGSILADRDALYTTFRVVFQNNEWASAYFADLYSTWAKSIIARFGESPLLSLNAYAFTGAGDPNPALAALPDMIVMGDGIQQVFQDLGLGDVAPQSILAHEFGHQVQYEDGLFDSPLTGAEATRRTELMADAFATYFLAHSRGASLQWKRVQLFVRVFHTIGDCGFTDPGHHGTPNQRMRSAEWAYGVVTGAANQGHILPSLTFAQLFDAALPTLVAPDAPN